MQATIIICLFLLLASASARHFGNFEGTRGFRSLGIHGGTHVNITKVPFMALLRLRDDEWGCGASIINKKFLISAAHCYLPWQVKQLRITVGTHNINKGKDYDIEKMVQHPKYATKTADYDISLIKLKKELVFNKYVQPIVLADSTMIPIHGDKMAAYGFGITERGNQSNELLKVEIPYVSRNLCKWILEPTYTITKRMICAGGVKGKDSCHSDSGGPLVYQNRLIGVVSWGHDCGGEYLPGVYASVPSMRDFIDEVIKRNS